MASGGVGVSPSSPRRKLIEVALPLDAINAAAGREKSARRPLAAARAVIFAQMVDDPSAWPELLPTDEDQDADRKRLFKLIGELVKWENTTNEEVLERARTEIQKAGGERASVFVRGTGCGGGGHHEFDAAVLKMLGMSDLNGWLDDLRNAFCREPSAQGGNKAALKAFRTPILHERAP